MYRRRGITLIEVLVTMFVMAIGLLGLLVLFPLAALNIAQAIQDDRAAQAATNAQAIADMYWDFRPADDWPYGNGDSVNTVDNTQPHTASLFVNAGSPRPDSEGPSWPLYVDPIGFRSTARDWVGNVSNGVRRIETPWISWTDTDGKTRFLPQTYFLLDDMMFTKNGTPLGNPGKGLQREDRYSWAYLLRRPRTASAKVVDMQIVVYAQRAIYGSGVSAGELAVNGVTGAAGANFIDIPWPLSQPVSVRKGIWLLDVTREPGGTGLKMYGPTHAFFYRVQNVVLQGPGLAPSSRRLELQTPLKAPVNQIIIMENVIDVFDKGAGWQQPHWRRDS